MSIQSASLGLQLEFLQLDKSDNIPIIDLSKRLLSCENGALVVSHSLCPQTSQTVCGRGTVLCPSLPL